MAFSILTQLFQGLVTWSNTVSLWTATACGTQASVSFLWLLHYAPQVCFRRVMQPVPVPAARLLALVLAPIPAVAPSHRFNPIANL